MAVSVESVAFCSHPALTHLAASGATDGSVCVWDLNTASLRHRLEDPSEAVIRVTWMPASPTLFACTADGAVFAWDARDGRLLARYTGPSGMVQDVLPVPLPRGSAIPAALSASSSGTVQRDNAALVLAAGDDLFCRGYVFPPELE
jgi:WD40 repeat protein